MKIHLSAEEINALTDLKLSSFWFWLSPSPRLFWTWKIKTRKMPHFPYRKQMIRTCALEESATLLLMLVDLRLIFLVCLRNGFMVTLENTDGSISNLVFLNDNIFIIQLVYLFGCLLSLERFPFLWHNSYEVKIEIKLQMKCRKQIKRNPYPHAYANIMVMSFILCRMLKLIIFA